MGRQVRMVPANWEHPKRYDTYRREMTYVPLYSGSGDAFALAEAEWNEEYAKWQEGFVRNYGDGEKWRPKEADEINMRFTEWSGSRPSPDDYMPNWPREICTHLMMYEDTSEGTPISPAFATPEELARWLTDNNASAFGGQTASYEAWLRVCQGGFAPSAVMDAKGLRSGVEAMADRDDG